MGCSDGDNIALPEDISMDCLDGHTGGSQTNEEAEVKPKVLVTKRDRHERPPSATVERSIARHAALACQTLRHHMAMSLKLVSDLHVEYNSTRHQSILRSGKIGEGQNSRSPQDNVAMGIIMLNSSLLKGLHVLDCLQSRCVQEYPELNYDLEDHLMSFDGSLTTIYEGHQSQKVVEDVEDLCERLLNGNLITTEDANAALTSQKDKYELDKVEMAEKQRQLEEQCEQLRLALEASQKSRPVTAETCTGSNPDAANSSGEILVYDSDEEEGNKSKDACDATKTANDSSKTVSLPEDEVTRLLSIIQRLTSRLTSTRTELGELKRKKYGSGGERRNSNGTSTTNKGENITITPRSAVSTRHGILSTSPNGRSPDDIEIRFQKVHEMNSRLNRAMGAIRAHNGGRVTSSKGDRSPRERLKKNTAIRMSR